MKKLILAALVMSAALGAEARGYHYWHGGNWGSPRFSFYWGGFPCYSAWYPAGYCYAPAPVYYPACNYDYYDYGYYRPSYAVGGTLSGALIGGVIGNGIHHQGWQGAGIGAAAGLVLGGLAEVNARSYERAADAAPRVSYSDSPPAAIANAPSVNNAPTVPDAPRAQSAVAYPPASSMSGANALFGR